MVFWIGILVSGAFAWSAIKRGFYETWAMLFNIVISIYLAVYLRPTIIDIVSSNGDTPYGNAIAMIGIAIGSFLILQGISYLLFISSVPFPKVFNTLGAGFLGFLAGFLVWSFANLLICITPISQNTLVKETGFSRSQFKQTNMPIICWWCNLIDTVASRQDNRYSTEQAVNDLLKSTEKKTRDKQAEPVEPDEPAEPNNVKTGIGGEKQSILPPDVKISNQ